MRVYSAADFSLAMLSTVDWPDETSSEFQTDRYSTDAVTTSPESSSTTSISLVPFQSIIAFFGFLGIFSNGLVLYGFWLSRPSKLTSTSVHIINHTALGLTTKLTTLLIYILIPSMIIKVVSAFWICS